MESEIVKIFINKQIVIEYISTQEEGDSLNNRFGH
jgi:hypothetical protein